MWSLICLRWMQGSMTSDSLAGAVVSSLPPLNCWITGWASDLVRERGGFDCKKKSFSSTTLFFKLLYMKTMETEDPPAHTTSKPLNLCSSFLPPFVANNSILYRVSELLNPQGIHNGHGSGLISLTLTGSWHAPLKWTRPIFSRAMCLASCSHIFRVTAPPLSIVKHTSSQQPIIVFPLLVDTV